jgi:TonB family protein
MMKTIKLLIVACLAVFTLAAYGQNAEELTQQGQEYLENDNYAEAFNCFKKAADQGYDLAEFALGGMYEYGLGVEQDHAAAMAWYKKAAAQGLEAAKDRLAEVEDDFVYEEDFADEEEVFLAAEQNPEFPGGVGAMVDFVNKNTHYPESELGNGVKGKVFVRFVVEKDGSITNAQVMRGLGEAFDAEALRVVSQLPKFSPGKRRGNPVRVQYMLPVSF